MVRVFETLPLIIQGTFILYSQYFAGWWLGDAGSRSLSAMMLTRTVSAPGGLHYSCWRHQMETFSMSPALCEGNPPVTGGFPSQRPVKQSFDVFFICAWTTCWANNRDAGDFRRHHAHYDVTVVWYILPRRKCYKCSVLLIKHVRNKSLSKIGRVIGRTIYIYMLHFVSLCNFRVLR